MASQKMSKNLMNSAYYQSYVQGKSSSKPQTAAKFNKVAVGGQSYPYPMQTQQRSAPKAPPAPQLTPKEIKKIKKQRRKERSYFFVMRKGICFLMFLMCLIIVAMLALSFIGIMPEYTSLYVKPDNTPMDAREEWEAENSPNEDGEDVYYEDASVHIGVSEFLYGFIGKFAPDFSIDAETGESKCPNYDAVLASLKEKNEAFAEGEYTDAMGTIAIYAFEYLPVAIIIMAITAVITLITSFFGMFGRRIFKGFGLAAIIMIVCAVVSVIAGLAFLGNATGYPSVEEEFVNSVVDFSRIGDYMLRMITGAPLTEFNPEIDIMPVAVASGFTGLAILAAPVLLLVFSIFARRKMPYSIFDK